MRPTVEQKRVAENPPTACR